jgi:type II secretory pathway pseudopilin PulG
MNKRTFRFQYFFLIFSLVTMPVLVLAQDFDNLSTRSSRARRAFKDAIEAYRLRDNTRTIQFLETAISHDGNFTEAHILLGEVHHASGNYQKSIESYENAVKLDSDFFPPAWFWLGESYLFSGNYQQAGQRFERFLQFEDISQNLTQQANDHLKTINFAISAIENPVPFEPVNLGEAINSQDYEYSPSLTTDEQILVFTRRQPRKDPAMMKYGSEYEDFYVSFWENGQWSVAVNLGSPINTPGNEGAQSISADGRHLFFTACNRPDGLGSCDIYYSHRIGQEWSKPVNMGNPVNSSAWDSQPSVSSDGNTLYFASARRGSKGPMDLWFSTRNEDGSWNMPRNMGDVINTSGREMSPFIHPDNNTLYFASDGHRAWVGSIFSFQEGRSMAAGVFPKTWGTPLIHMLMSSLLL